VLFLLSLALIVSVAQLAELLPQYSDQLTQVVTDAGNTLRSLGVQQEQINAVVNAIDPGQLVALVGTVLSSTLGVLSNVFFLIVLLFFMAFDTDSTRRSLAVLGTRMPDVAAALSSFARGARNYMGVSAGFGFIVAVLDGLALVIMGVPPAALRGGGVLQGPEAGSEQAHRPRPPNWPCGWSRWDSRGHVNR
jgi:AI-2 transport protein TqsA